MDTASRSHRSHNASASRGPRCNSMNLWKERFQSTTQITNSALPTDKFNHRGDIFIGPLG
jgi:phage FluMu protein Com